MTRRLIAALLLIMMVLVPSFAGGSKESDGPVTLEILISGDTTEGAPMQKAVARFNEEYKDKGIQVECNEIAYADLTTQITNRARAGELPALVKNTTATLDQFVDYYYPLDETGLNPEDFSMDYCVRDGKFIACVLNTTSAGLFINKTAFDAAGVSYPTCEEERWTWDEFRDAIEEVMAKTDIQYGFGLDYSQDRLSTILYQFGARVTREDDPSVITLRSPETKAALEFLKGMIDDGLFPVTMATGIDNSANTFKTGLLAAEFGGNWNLLDFTNNIKDFEFIPVLMPYESVKATTFGGNMISVFDGTGKEKEAIEFIKWFYQPENYQKYLDDAGYLSGLTTMNAEYKLAGLDVFQEEIKVSDQVHNEDQAVKIAHPGSSYGNTIRENAGRYFAGEITLDDALDRMINDIMIAYPDVTEGTV